jgi:hypothetical protein
MSAVAEPVAPPAGGKSLFTRFWGLLTSPREAFADVVARPRVLGMMGLVILVSVTCTAGFLSTSVGKQAYLDQAVRATESFSGQVTDERYALLERMSAYAAPLVAVQMAVLGPLVWLILAGILFAGFNAAIGGDASFRQVFAVVVHSSAVTVVQQLFVTPLNVVRESMSSATNLSVFLPMLDESSFITRFLGTIDVFLIWQVVVLAAGLGVLYRRRTGPIAIGLFVVYGIIAIIIAAVTSGRAGA